MMSEQNCSICPQLGDLGRTWTKTGTVALEVLGCIEQSCSEWLSVTCHREPVEDAKERTL